jgi:hypothetical protein
VAHCWKGLEQADAVVELHGSAMKVLIDQQVVHADANLQDAFVQVPDLTLGGPPEELQGFVLLEKLA